MHIARIHIDYSGSTWFVLLASAEDVRYLDISPFHSVRAELGPDDGPWDKATAAWLRSALYELADDLVSRIKDPTVDQADDDVPALFDPLSPGDLAP